MKRNKNVLPAPRLLPGKNKPTMLTMGIPGVGTSTKPGNPDAVVVSLVSSEPRYHGGPRFGRLETIPGASPPLSWWGSRSVNNMSPFYSIGLNVNILKVYWKKHLETHMVLISDLESLLGGRSIFQGFYPFLELACQMAKQTDGWKCSRITWPLQKKRYEHVWHYWWHRCFEHVCFYRMFQWMLLHPRLHMPTIWSTKLPSSRLPRRLKQHETTNSKS